MLAGEGTIAVATNRAGHLERQRQRWWQRQQQR